MARNEPTTKMVYHTLSAPGSGGTPQDQVLFHYPYNYRTTDFANYNWGDKSIMLGIIQPAEGCSGIMTFTSGNVDGSGSRTIKLHWNTSVPGQYIPEVYISGWELAGSETYGEDFWYMVIYKLKTDQSDQCSTSHEVEHRYAIRSLADFHYLANSYYNQNWTNLKCATNKCYAWWFSDLAVGLQTLSVPVVAAISDTIYQTDYSHQLQHVWLFKDEPANTLVD